MPAGDAAHTASAPPSPSPLSFVLPDLAVGSLDALKGAAAAVGWRPSASRQAATSAADRDTPAAQWTSTRLPPLPAARAARTQAVASGRAPSRFAPGSSTRSMAR